MYFMIYLMFVFPIKVNSLLMLLTIIYSYLCPNYLLRLNENSLEEQQERYSQGIRLPPEYNRNIDKTQMTMLQY